ncbi:MAG TPA: hypothetical protein VF095_06150 [Bacillota bacterium]
MDIYVTKNEIGDDMDHDQQSKHVINNYKQDEKMMILIYAQWCVNNDLDPISLYEKAYPDQPNNEALQESLELTVPKTESDAIADHIVLQSLQLFGNNDLAFVVQQAIDQRT